ncbi:MAG: hypothetical protein GQ527_10760 [Bacteroidales bacterium]|nr:hypothetical protein [Bacteroidales bacterium]
MTKTLKIFIALYSLFSMNILLAQQYYSFTPITTSSYKGNMISTDDVGNLLIGSKAHLTKLDMNGHFLANYFPLFHGSISCIDAKDPRRILLYYKEYAYVQFLNQELANASSLSVYSVNTRPEPISLESLNLTFASLACLDEYNDAYWVYDENTTDIVLVDKDNQVDFKADDLDQLMDDDPNPNYMVMEENRLFINNPASGVYIFDENGSFVRILPLMGLKKVQVFKDLLFYTTNSALVVHHLVTGEESYNPLPVLGFHDWALSKDMSPMRINFLTNQGVLIYSIDEIK